MLLSDLLQQLAACPQDFSYWRILSDEIEDDNARAAIRWLADHWKRPYDCYGDWDWYCLEQAKENAVDPESDLPDCYFRFLIAKKLTFFAKRDAFRYKSFVRALEDFIQAFPQGMKYHRQQKIAEVITEIAYCYGLANDADALVVNHAAGTVLHRSYKWQNKFSLTEDSKGRLYVRFLGTKRRVKL